MAETEQEQRARVIEIARSFIGTPYHHAGMIKGVGVDCLTLIYLVFKEAGLVGDIDIPQYGPQWHLNRHVERYRDGLLQYTHLITQEQAKPGDIVLYHWGHVKAHGGIIMERGWPQIINAYSRAGFVIEADGTGGELADRETEFFSYW